MQDRKAHETQRFTGFQRRASIALYSAALLLAFYGGTLQVRKMQRTTEQEALKPIVSLLGLPEQAQKEQVYEQCGRLMADHDEARKARIAKRLGMYADWNSLFRRIEGMGEAERAPIVASIAEDYKASPNLNWPQLKKQIIMGAGPLPRRRPVMALQVAD